MDAYIRDRKGRLYWQFAAEPEKLFCQPYDAFGQLEFEKKEDEEEEKKENKWVCYEGIDEIARVIRYLNPRGIREGPLRDVLLRHFPKVVDLVKEEEGAEEDEKEDMDVDQEEEKEGAEDGGMDVGDEWKNGEKVVVRKGQALWNAVVLCRSGEFYRVRYEGWESKYDEWVQAGKIVSRKQAKKGKNSESESKKTLVLGWCKGGMEDEELGCRALVRDLLAYQ